MKKKLFTPLRALPNRGINHIFLGDPYGNFHEKVTVEAGNVFSPGLTSCGVSLFFADDAGVHSPELLTPEEIRWRLEPPVSVAEFCLQALQVHSELISMGRHCATEFCRNRVQALRPVNGYLGVLIRDVGPCGAKIRSLTVNGTKLLLNNNVEFSAERNCRIQIFPATGKFDSPMGLFYLPLRLAAGRSFEFNFKAVHVYSGQRLFTGEAARISRRKVATAIAGRRRQWRKELPVAIECPNKLLTDSFERNAFHLISAMECGFPRIGVMNYPQFWLRDGIIILRALDLLGRPDLSEAGREFLLRNHFCGGFGAESDAPGEGIWTLVQHAVLYRDRKFLRRAYPAILEKVAILVEMLEAETPIYSMSESRIAKFTGNPTMNLLCAPAENGCINGRMDWGVPALYINLWALSGLNCAAQAAEMLAREKDVERFRRIAGDLRRNIETFLLPSFGRNVRDLIVTPYPAGGIVPPDFRSCFIRFRYVDGKPFTEPEWTYFEAAHIHNAMLLGHRDLAWPCLDQFLRRHLQPQWEISAFCEAKPGAENESFPFGNDKFVRGWLSREHAAGANMPHNWTAAELVNLVRDMFVCEQDGKLLLGLGAKREWREYGVRNFPTRFGPVSYHVSCDGGGEIIKCSLDVPDGVEVAFHNRN